MKRIPCVCNECGRKNPGMQLQFVSELSERCVICGSELQPAATIHLAVPCPPEEAHPVIKPKNDGGKIIHQKLSCKSKELPKYLTALPEAATCYECLFNHRSKE